MPHLHEVGVALADGAHQRLRSLALQAALFAHPHRRRVHVPRVTSRARNMQRGGTRSGGGDGGRMCTRRRTRDRSAGSGAAARAIRSLACAPKKETRVTRRTAKAPQQHEGGNLQFMHWLWLLSSTHAGPCARCEMRRSRRRARVYRRRRLVLAEGLAAPKTAGAEHERVRKQEYKSAIIYLLHSGAAR